MPFDHPVENDPEKTIAESSDTSAETRSADELRDFFHIPPFEPSNCGEMNLLGLGGMGIVYEVDDPALQRKVALKMLRQPYRNNPEHLRKFVNEARITAKIGHPNIIAVHQLGIDDQNGAYFSMHRIKGETLQRILKKLRLGDPQSRRNYTPRRLLEIFISGCNAVSAAHQKGILHCDLKPSNIMVGSFGEVWVLDWGLAQNIAENPPPDQDNSDGKLKLEGTPVFMAPELISGQQAKPDVLTDVYALGTILYSIITWQQTPFAPEQDQKKLFQQIVQGKVISISRSISKGHPIRPELVAICRKAMAVNRQERYQSAGELLADLHNYQDHFPVKAYSSGLLYRFGKLCSRHPLIPLTLIISAITFGVFHASKRLVEYTEDRSMLKIAIFNANMAQEHRNQFLSYRKKLNSFENNLSPLQIAITERNMILSANLAMMEYFAALDAADGSSHAGIQAFLKNGGTEICKQLLKLRISTGSPTDPQATLDRCRRRWGSLFEAAASLDRELAKLIQHIDRNQGVISLITENENVIQRVTVISPSGTSLPMAFKSNCFMELSAGTNDFLFSASDGCVFSARYHVVPGESLSCVIPDFPHIHGMQLILADQFINKVSGVGSFQCNVPAYLIAEKDISIAEYMDFLSALPEKERKKLAPTSNKGSAVVTTEGAMAYCSAMKNKWKIDFRLPHPVELKKAFSPGKEPGKTFYNLQNPVPDVPLLLMPDRKKRCRIFIPGKNKIVYGTAKTAAAFRIVAELK